MRLVDLIPDAEVLCALEQRAGRPPKCRALAGLLLYARPAREASRLQNSLVTVEKFVMRGLYACVVGCVSEIATGRTDISRLLGIRA